jgi:hypothetical protein
VAWTLEEVVGTKTMPVLWAQAEAVVLNKEGWVESPEHFREQ